MADIAPDQQHRRTVVVESGVTLLAIGLMAWDHLWGNERGLADSFPVDPATFFISLALIVVTAVVVFGFTVRRAAGHPEAVHRSALIHSGIALVLALPLSWLGFPAVVAGGGVALGLQGLRGIHRRVSIAATSVGVLVIVFAILVTTFPTAPDAT
ncbi:hypothetical protein ACGFIF_32895 [Kribbella sp. NPDC049174]|uniref:hypothetical protein n=1 Tax=Kribbella sp. NPDC049174 TaxID=3364112 RepID=UPI00371D98A7